MSRVKTPAKYKSHEIVLEWSRGGHGCAMARVEAFETASGYPIGCVWFRHNGKDNQILETLQSFVSVKHRRRGIRTMIHKQLIAWFPKVRQIVTPAAAGPEARGFLKSAGFKIDPLRGFVLTLSHEPKRKTKIRKSRPAARHHRARTASAAKRVSGGKNRAHSR